jgi:hypothetical protein
MNEQLLEMMSGLIRLLEEQKQTEPERIDSICLELMANRLKFELYRLEIIVNKSLTSIK